MAETEELEMPRQSLNVTVDEATIERLAVVENKSAYVRQIIEIRDRDWRFAIVQVLRTIPPHLVGTAVKAVEHNLHRAWPSRHNISGSIRVSDWFDHDEQVKLVDEMTDLSAWSLWTLACELDLGNQAVQVAIDVLDIGEQLRTRTLAEPGSDEQLEEEHAD